MSSRKEKAAQFANDSYNIEILGRNVLVTDAMKNYAVEKISKIERFTNRIIDVIVRMDIQRVEHRVEIMLSTPHIVVKSHASTNDMYVSIDRAVEKIERQLQKYKSKIKDHQARGTKSMEMRVNVFGPHNVDDVTELNEEIEKENLSELTNNFDFKNRVVEEENVIIKLLTNDEAIMKMDLSGDPFMVYIGEEDRKVKVIYRREDGNYGIMEPQNALEKH